MTERGRHGRPCGGIEPHVRPGHREHQALDRHRVGQSRIAAALLSSDRYQSGTTPTTEPKDRPGVAHLFMSPVACCSLSFDQVARIQP